MKIKNFYNKGLDLSSLHKLYIFVWMVTTILYSFHFVGYYGSFDWGGKFSRFLFAMLFAMLISSLHIKGMRSVKIRVDFNSLLNNDTVALLTKRINGLFWFWVAGNLITVMLQGGFPLLWKLVGIPKTYADYGIPTFNGFLISIYYLCGVVYFIALFKDRRRRNILRFAVLVLFPILTINRALFLALTLQCMGMFVLTNKIKVKTLLIIIALVLILVIGFGILGDLRLGENKYIIRDLVSDEYSEIQEKIPSGFIWTYLYSTGTIDNLNYNYGNIERIGHPYFTLQPLIPSVLRSFVFGVTDYENKYSLSMRNLMFNTFSWIANYLRDFGPGMTIIVVYLYGLLFKRIQDRARKGSIKHVLLYPVMFMVVMLSVFWDYMISLPTIFEIIIICRVCNSRELRSLEKETLFYPSWTGGEYTYL